MEWLGVLLLYLISGFMKKRQQNKNRKIIESDPDWDNEDYLEPEQPSNNFEQLLNDLFEQNPKTPDPSSTIKDLLVSENENQVEEISETQWLLFLLSKTKVKLSMLLLLGRLLANVFKSLVLICRKPKIWLYFYGLVH